MVQNAKLYISFTAANLGPDFSPDQQAGFSRSLTKGCIKLEDTSHWNGGKFVEKVVFVKKAPQEKFKNDSSLLSTQQNDSFYTSHSYFKQSLNASELIVKRSGCQIIVKIHFVSYTNESNNWIQQWRGLIQYIIVTPNVPIDYPVSRVSFDLPR